MADNLKTKVDKLVAYGNEQLASKGISEQQTTLRKVLDKISDIQAGGGELPEYMSAKNFTFDGNACTGYVGDTNMPQIIIPNSYSKEVKVNYTLGAKITNKSNFVLLLNASGTLDLMLMRIWDSNNNSVDYTTVEDISNNLATDFPEGCYIEYVAVRDYNSWGFIRNAISTGTIKSPVYLLEGDQQWTEFASGDELYNYLVENQINEITLSNKITTTNFFDGNDYTVDTVSSVNNSSGFKDYTGEVILLDNITNIGDYAFSNSKITKIILPNSLQTIGNNAFMSSSITELIIPQGISDISLSLCYNCKNLKNVTLPSSVSNIQQYAFQYNDALEEVKILATTPPTITSNSFNGTDNAIFRVPAESVDLYKSAEIFSTFADKIYPINYDGLSTSSGISYQIQAADIPDRTISLIDETGQTLDTKQTPATTGGVVTFNVSNVGNYTVTSSDSAGQVWSTTVVVDGIGLFTAKVPDIDTTDNARYALNRYTPAQWHLACQNGYFSVMFDIKSKFNYTDNTSIFNNYDFFVEDIQTLEDGSEVVYFRMVNDYGSYNINPSFAYMSSAEATEFNGYYSNSGGYKYSAMRQRMMVQGESVYSQATGLKPSGNTTIADGTGIEFDKLYYTNGNGTTSGVYTYDYTTDTFTQDSEMEYFSSTSIASQNVKFVKGYFVSVGQITEEQFNSGYYYTSTGTASSTSNPLRYTQATTYTSGTTYYGFYETLQENGVFYDALLNFVGDYLVRTNDLSSAGNNQTEYLSSTNDYCDIPCVEQITGTNRTTRLWGNRNASTNTSGTSIYSHNIAGEGTKMPAYNDFQVQATGSYYWTRSSYSASAYSFCFIFSIGYIFNYSTPNPHGVRVGFPFA